MAKKKMFDPINRDSYGVSSRGDSSPQIKHNRPEVARHVARIVIANNMDYSAAVSKMIAADYPDATENQVEALAATLRKSPNVQREMAAMLEEIGYGNDALKKLIGVLWSEVLGSNDKRWAAAARLLAEITDAAKASSKGTTLPSLKLDGMEQGLQSLLGEHAPTNADVMLEDMPEDTEDEEM